jgi:GT2 family glycosyltransferase
MQSEVYELTSIMPMVSVIILNYNGAEYIERCINSVLNSDYENLEIIVVDNASTDLSDRIIESKFRCKKVRIFANSKNLGYAEGNNVGAREAKGQYLVFLNNDTEVDSRWLNSLVETMESDSDIGAAQFKILRMTRKSEIDTCGHMLTRFGFTYERGSGEVDLGQYDYVTDIFAGKGAALAVKRDLFEKTGEFDADFFILREDTDLCWRIWLTGKRVVFFPRGIVYHAVGGALGKHEIEALYYFRRNMIITIIKNTETRTTMKIIPMHLFLSLIDCFFTDLSNRGLTNLRSFFRGLIWIVRNCPLLEAKKREIGKFRKLNDKVLLPRVMARVSILDKLIERDTSRRHRNQ